MTAAASAGPRKRRQKKKSPAPRRWLIPTAVAAFIACAWLFYYLDNLPQARTIGARQTGQARDGDQVRLHGLPAGEALHLDIGSTATVNLAVGRGARWLGDPQATAGQPANAELHFRLVNQQPQNLFVTFRLPAERADRRPLLILEPVLADRSYLQLAVISPESPLTVDMGILPLSDAPVRSEIQLIRPGIQPSVLADARFSVPAGTPVTFGIGETGRAALRLRVGDAAGVEIGSVADSAFERRWMVCGSPRGRVLWQRPLPGISIGDCEPRRLADVELNLADGVDIEAQGTGFTVGEDGTNVWSGFRSLRQNAVVQSLLSALVVALVGWVILVVRRKAR